MIKLKELRAIYELVGYHVTNDDWLNIYMKLEKIIKEIEKSNRPSYKIPIQTPISVMEIKK